MNSIKLLSLSVSLFISLISFVAVGQSDAGEEDKPEYESFQLEVRNFDRRESLQMLANPSADQLEALASFRSGSDDLAVSYDAATGVTRALFNRAGYLSKSVEAADPVDLAMSFVETHLQLLGLDLADLSGIVVRDNVFSAVTGASHVYLGQYHLGLPVYNAQLQVNVNRSGRLISVNNSFMPAAAASANNPEAAVKAAPAVFAAAEHLGISLSRMPFADTHPGDEPVLVHAASLSSEPILARKMWVPVRQGVLRLVWNFQLHTHGSNHIFDLTVDAHDGTVWTRFDWVASDDYRVYPLPIESPNFTTPLPPADARIVAIDPRNMTASPFGWHDTDGVDGPEFTITRGNNVHAYDDSNNRNGPSSTAPEPDGGVALSFDEAMDLSMEPQTYADAATVELFYWNNIIHDVLWHYGFDEAAGNFQVTNHSGSGLGNDDVRAESQDGSGSNNANFATPPEGSRPRMQMYRFNITSPGRDGDFDHGVVIHEYGHGISNRLVGGPSNVGCLSGTQQPGEGISDWYWLALTHQAGLTGETSRGAGTYVLGQPTDGGGVRPQPYSTDPTVNSYTYETIRSGVSVPHGLGSVWANAAYEVYWALVDAHGFDPDLFSPMNGGGNQRALLYFTEGLKNASCGSDFLGIRDGVIQAAMDNFSAEDVCTIWQAFADFGLGADAISPGVHSRLVTNGFELPVSCMCVVPPTPTNLVASCDQLNVSLDWEGSAERYNVYRSVSACSSATYSLLAEGLLGTSYTDSSTSMGSTYSYVVRGTTDSSLCETANSDCSEVTFSCGSLLTMASSWGSCFDVLNIIGCL